MRERHFELVLPEARIPISFACSSIDWATQRAAELIQPGSRVAILSDERVALHYEPDVRQMLANSGYDVHSFIFPGGETGKTLKCISDLIDELAIAKFSRSDWILGMGGGVTTDIAGFTAAIFQRGIQWIALPTSLLGMVDAAIGGKTGVNQALGKNYIGSFHQPQAVFASLHTLRTLSPQDWRCGGAEIVKVALIAGGALWDQLQKSGLDFSLLSEEEQLWIISEAAQIKISIVAEDEREGGKRRLLNFGHTFAHALEQVTRYEKFSHGEAVFLGMHAAVRLSHLMNMLSEEETTFLEGFLSQYSLPSTEVSQEQLIDALDYDKKITGKKLNWVLLQHPGSPVLETEVPLTLVKETAHGLCDLLQKGGSSSQASFRLRILILNGPNLNLLGERETDIYGTSSYSELVDLIQNYAAAHEMEILIRQTNEEGKLINYIQWARRWADGILINPGGYTHSSVAIRDALAAVNLPVVEVHLSDLEKRESFRQKSLIQPISLAQIQGRGLTSYTDALKLLQGHILNRSAHGIPAETSAQRIL